MKTTKASKILNDFLKIANSTFDPNDPEQMSGTPKSPKKVPLSTHWHPEEPEGPAGCNSVGRGAKCELTGPHGDHQSGNKRWTN